MAWLIAGIVFLILIYAGLRWASEADPKIIRYALLLAGVVFLSLIAFIFILTGRVAVSWPFILGAAGLYLRLRSAIGVWELLGRIVRNKRSGGQGRASSVSTSHLRMTLDHASATLDGEIIKGLYAGEWLSDLSTAQLLEKLQELRADDMEGARLLESYLDRTEAGWRATHADEGESHAQPSSSMTREEALEILGLQKGATKEKIRAAHKELMRKFHPDAGGSSYLASKINQAKDVLLGNGR